MTAADLDVDELPRGYHGKAPRQPQTERKRSRDALVAVRRQLVGSDVVVSEAEEFLGGIRIVLALRQQQQSVREERR